MVLEEWMGSDPCRWPFLSLTYMRTGSSCDHMAKSIKLRENVLMVGGSTAVRKDTLGCKEQKFPTCLINRRGSCNWGCREQASELFHKAALTNCERTGFFPFLLLLSCGLLLEAATSLDVGWLPLVMTATDSPVPACLTSYGFFPKARNLLHPNPSKLVLATHWPKVTWASPLPRTIPGRGMGYRICLGQWFSNLLALGPFILLRIIEDSKELLVLWVTSIETTSETLLA